MCPKAKTWRSWRFSLGLPSLPASSVVNWWGPRSRQQMSIHKTFTSCFQEKNNPAVPLVVTNVRIQILSEILPQILCIFFPARGHPPNPSSFCFHPLPAQNISQYTTLFFLTISSLVFKPNSPWKVPSLQIHLSSICFNLPHSVHLQPAPGLWLAVFNFSLVVLIFSRRVTLTDPSLGPSYSEQPFWKCLSSPVPAFKPGFPARALHLLFVFAHLWVIESVEPTYWKVFSGWMHSSRYVNHSVFIVCEAGRWTLWPAILCLTLKWVDVTSLLSMILEHRSHFPVFLWYYWTWPSASLNSKTMATAD